MYAMGQRVAKTLDGSRPGYRGEGEYQGGRGIGGSKSSKSDKGTGGDKGNIGGGGGGQNTEYRSYRAPTKKTYTSKTIDSKPVTGDDYRRSQNDFVNTLNRNNQIRAQQTGTKFTPYQGGARTTDYYNSSPLSSLVKLATGIAIPGAGFLMNYGGNLKDGIIGLNNKIQNSDFGRSTSLMDYLDMKKYGGFNEREMARRINMDEAKLLQDRIDAGEFDGKNASDGTYTMSTFNNEFAPSGEIGQSFDEIKTIDLNNIKSIIEASQAPQKSSTDFMYASPQFQEGIDNSMYGGDRMLFGKNNPNELYYYGDVLPGGDVIESEADGITNYDFAKGGIASL
jgi:hypothetical protein